MEEQCLTVEELDAILRDIESADTRSSPEPLDDNLVLNFVEGSHIEEASDFVLDLDTTLKRMAYSDDTAIECELCPRPASPAAMTSDVNLSVVHGNLRSPTKKRVRPAAERPRAKAPAAKRKKGRKELPHTSKLKYGWNPSGDMFKGCVRVQAKGDLVHENWSKEEVEQKLDDMISKWKWNEETSRHSNKNVPRWLHKVMSEHGSGWFVPQTVVVNKLDYTDRRSPSEGSTKFYPPYDALCCGYEVRRCPFTEMDSDRSKMRLSPVFVERLQRHNLMD